MFLLAFAATTYDVLAPGFACGLWSEEDDPKDPPTCWTGLQSIWPPKVLAVAEVQRDVWKNYREFTVTRANQNPSAISLGFWA